MLLFTVNLLNYWLRHLAKMPLALQGAWLGRLGFHHFFALRLWSLLGIWCQLGLCCAHGVQGSLATTGSWIYVIIYKIIYIYRFNKKHMIYIYIYILYMLKPYTAKTKLRHAIWPTKPSWDVQGSMTCVVLMQAAKDWYDADGSGLKSF